MSEPQTWPAPPFATVRWRVAEVYDDGGDADPHPDWQPLVGARVELVPSITGLAVYDAPDHDPITIKIGRVFGVIDAGGWLVSDKTGELLRIAATDDPHMSVTGWTWMAQLAGSGASIRFSAPAGGEVDLSEFVLAPAVDATKAWIARIPELLDAAGSLVSIQSVTSDGADIIVTLTDGTVGRFPIPEGAPGSSAYDVAVEQGFVGDVSAWLASLKGDKGDPGEQPAGDFVTDDDPRLTDARTPTAHDHDDRYYTETETDALLADKADSGHDHNGVYDPAGTAAGLADAIMPALHSHSNKAALDQVSGVNTGDQTLPTWSTLSGKPAVIAAGATAADARTAIGAAPALGSDDNYVTDAEKLALHSHSNKTALDTVSGVNGNSAVGHGSQRSLTTGDYNSAVGHGSQRALTTGNGNSAVGYGSQRALTTGGYNSAVGHGSQFALTTGGYNSALGGNAQLALTTGGYNSAVGHGSQFALTTGNGNSAVGYDSQRALMTGNYNSAVGYGSQRALTIGNYNSAVGHGSQFALTTGGYNSALGGNAQADLTIGNYNSAVGHGSQFALTTGNYNSAVGYGSQRSLTTGGYNSALGGNAGYTDSITATVATVTYATMLGYNAQATVSNVCVIGSALSSERQTLCLGNYDALGSDVRGGFALSNAQTVPTTDPTGGGILYAEGGALKWRGSAGTITTIAAA